MRKARRPGVVPIIAVGLVLTATGCGNSTSDNAQPPRHTTAPVTSSSPAVPLYDPPHQFSADPVATLNDAFHAVVSGTMVYYFGNTADQGIRSADIEGYDLTTGKTWQYTPPDVSFDGPEIPAGQPGHLLAVAAPGQALYYVGSVLQPGQGTQRSQFTAAVGSLAAQSGTSQWQVSLPLPSSYYQDDAFDPQQDVDLTLIGADEHHLVVQAVGPDDSPPVVWVLDPATGRTMWTRSGFEAIGFGSDTVVAFPTATSPIDFGKPEGLNADTGSVRWPALATKVTDVGYAMVGPDLIELTEFAPLDSATYLVKVNSGKLLTTLNDGAYKTCLFNQVNTVVCPSDDSLIALDATSGHRLWSLPDPHADRISPALHVAYEGLLYAQGESAGVILNARDGSDAVDNVSLAPDVVVPGFGLVLDDTADTVTVYRATS